MDVDITIFHYMVFIPILMLWGAINHVIRGKVNFLSDKPFNNDTVNLFLSNGFGLIDMALFIEYDDYGFYKFESSHNLNMSIISTAIIGFLIAALNIDIAKLMVISVNMGLASLVDLLALRWGQIFG